VPLRHPEMTLMLRLAMTLGLALAGPAAAEPFVLLIHEAPDQIALRDDPGAAGQAYWKAYADFGAEAAAAGVMRGGAAMVPAPVGEVGVPRETGALVLGGFFQIDVPDAAEARRWASKLPAAATGSVEVRAVVAAPGM
jgi:hypothetical protein